MSTKELEQNQKLILEKLETLVSDRDKLATKEDIDKLDSKIDRVEAKLESKIDGVEAKLDSKIESKVDGVEAKLESKIDGVSSQVKELNDKSFSEQGSLGNRVTRLEHDSKFFKWVGGILGSGFIAFIVWTFKKFFS